MKVNNLIIEIGTEELPPKSLKKLASSFAENIEKALNDSNFSFTKVNWFASPRRLAVSVIGLNNLQNDIKIEKKGPAVSAAFDAQGQATAAALGWAKANSIEISDTTRLKTDKGEWLFYEGMQKGAELKSIICNLVEKALTSLPIPKPMKWGNNTIQFIRPIHTICLVYGQDLLEGKVLGLSSKRTVLGHRFHGDKSFELSHADDYLPQLKKHFVVADFFERKEKIRAEIESKAKAQNAIADLNEDLLEEISALVEWPVALTARFEEDFLSVPKEALIYTMKGDQKYVPLLNADKSLKPNFIFISNIDSKQPELVVSGNEKVIRPRLADAQFFFETDKKHTLFSRLDSLKTILFQKQLGTLFDKSQRIGALAQEVARLIGANEEHAFRAGLLSKTDLMTNMVMEFPDVQGVMGMYYALLDGEEPSVANALNEQYMPRFSGDSLPDAPISIAIAIADKIDTLVGIFGIGQVPKGDKDPFALRRAAIGVLRILVENDIHLDLSTLINYSITTFGDKLKVDKLSESVIEFILARFRAWFTEKGFSIDVIQAVAAIKPTVPADFSARVSAIAKFKLNDSAVALAAANKRVANILSKNPITQFSPILPELLVEADEKRLVDCLYAAETKLKGFIELNQYDEALNLLSELREPIDLFFENVMVMSEDEKVKENRLQILDRLRGLFLSCGDISLLS